MRGCRPGRSINDLYHVGQEVAGGTITEICFERGNIHAKVLCPICGKVTESNMQRLVSNRRCACQKSAGMAAAAVERSKDRKQGVNVGDVIHGRKIISIGVNKWGKTAIEVQCIYCEKQRTAPLTEIQRGITCPCQAHVAPAEEFIPFLTEAEHSLYIKRMPVRKLHYGLDDVCYICGKRGTAENGLERCHKIPFAMGIRFFGLTPQFLDRLDNITTGHRLHCNKACEFTEEEVEKELDRLGLVLPEYVVQLRVERKGAKR
jgi:hypothetical protein